MMSRGLGRLGVEAASGGVIGRRPFFPGWRGSKSVSSWQLIEWVFPAHELNSYCYLQLFVRLCFLTWPMSQAWCRKQMHFGGKCCHGNAPR